jgi:adenylate cyclase
VEGESDAGRADRRPGRTRRYNKTLPDTRHITAGWGKLGGGLAAGSFSGLHGLPIKRGMLAINPHNPQPSATAAAARGAATFGIKTIGAKIFALVVFLLLLTVALSVFLLLEVSRARDELRVIAQLDVPLSESAAKIDEYGLRKRMAFERWFGALNAAGEPNAEVVAEAAADHATYTAKVMGELAKFRAILAGRASEVAGRDTLVEVRTLAEQIEAAYPAVTARQRKLIEVQQAGDHERANRELNYLDDAQRTIQAQRSQLDARMDDMLDEAMRAGEGHQRYVQWLTVAATASTVMLGLGVALLIVKRLTRPVRSLVVAMRDVRGGNLDVRVPVESADEVGVLSDTFNFFVGELRVKEQIKRTFGKYIDPRVLEHLLVAGGGNGGAADENGEAAGGKRVMTVLFADLVGYTNMSERLTPSRMVTLLNRHFGLQAQAVHDHSGVVDKFLGDAVMAFWGPPFVKGGDDALLACRAARAQVAMIAALRKEIPEITGLRKDAPTLDLRVGICTGEVIVGNIGSENTRNYTVIGDTVNLTSRLEGANRIYGTQILVGESTALAAGAAIETREIDSMAVKGKSEPTRVFELLGAGGAVGDEDQRLRDAYGRALKNYRAQAWDQAEVGFGECLGIRATDGPSAVMLKRVRALRATPPGENWDGVWHLAEK